MTDLSGFHRAVVAELDRHRRKGYDEKHDDEHGLDHLLDQAFDYISRGQTVKAGALIMAAKAYRLRHTKNSMQEDIEEFMRRCDQAVATYPQLPDEDVVTLRIRLMVEELLGSIEPAVNMDIPAIHGRYVELLVKNKSDELIASMLKGDLVGVADGLADVLYVVIGTAVAYGIDIQEVFDEVHRSNLSKTVWNEDLKRYIIEKDEFGKGLKPDTYSPADLEPIVLRQIENGKAWEEFLSDPSDDSELIVATIEV
jgi:predicted HAD superfamily Cof-like phosphohydrolase